MTGTAVQKGEGVTLGEHMPATSPATITDMIQLAIEKGIPVEALEKLVALHERVSDRAARTEFATALADFQKSCPPITKDSTAKITTRGGSSYSYQYADLDHIAVSVREPLHLRGFSFSWDSRTEGKMLTATCTLRHVNGHQEQASFQLPVDSASAMSEQQKYVAALSFAKRMSLVQVLGLTTSDPDTDGMDPETISEDHAIEIEELIETAMADKARFLSYMGVAAVRDIRRGDLNKAFTALEEKIKEHKRGKPVKS